MSGIGLSSSLLHMEAVESRETNNMVIILNLSMATLFFVKNEAPGK